MDVPEIGKTYKDVMIESGTRGKHFLCIDINQRGHFESIDYRMKNIDTGDTNWYSELCWELVTEDKK